MLVECWDYGCVLSCLVGSLDIVGMGLLEEPCRQLVDTWLMTLVRYCSLRPRAKRIWSRARGGRARKGSLSKVLVWSG